MQTNDPQIKRTPPDEKRLAKKRNEEEAQRQAEVEYSLDLVPFGSVAHIPFEKIKFGEAAVRTVVIRNPSAKNVQVLLEKLPKPEKGFEVDYADFVLGPKEGDFIKHLAYLGYDVKHNQTPLDEFDFAVTNIATDLKCGVRLCRIMEILTSQNITSKLRIPVVSRLQNIHNVDLALKALAKSEAGMPPHHTITSKDIVNGHMEKTLGLLWHLIFGFQLGQILHEDRLSKEIQFLEKCLHFKALSVNDESALAGFNFVNECKRRELKEEGTQLFNDKNDWAKTEKFKLLLKWARLVCSIHGIEVENLSTSFSDGRALCVLVHHYYPGFMPKK